MLNPNNIKTGQRVDVSRIVTESWTSTNSLYNAIVKEIIFENDHTARVLVTTDEHSTWDGRGQYFNSMANGGWFYTSAFTFQKSVTFQRINKTISVLMSSPNKTAERSALLARLNNLRSSFTI